MNANVKSDQPPGGSSSKMGCAGAGLFIVVVWGFFFWQLWVPSEETAVFNFGLAFIVATAALTFIMLGIICFKTAYGNVGKRRLFAPETLARPPTAEGRAVVQGIVEAIGEPLQSPFLKVDCVAYQYDIYDLVRQSSKNTTRRRLFYTGYYLQPARIRSPWGHVRILAMPALESKLTRKGPVDEGQAFIASRFETDGDQQTKSGRLDALVGLLEAGVEVSEDDDGTIEIDQRLQDPPGLDTLIFEETALPSGVQVVASGDYDPHRRAMVPNATHPLTIELGTAQESRPTIPGIGLSFLLGLILLAVPIVPVVLWYLPDTGLTRQPDSEPQPADRVESILQALQDSDESRVKQLLSLGIPHDAHAKLLFHVEDDSMQRILIEGGIDANTSDGFETLIVGVDTVEFARFLLDKGADPNIATSNGQTPLVEALMNRHTEIVGLLLDAGADPDTPGSNGNPPLIEAIFGRNLVAIDQLLSAGADVTATDRDGRTPLEVAEQFEIKDVETLSRLRPR